jgi:hypothetical protein
MLLSLNSQTIPKKPQKQHTKASLALFLSEVTQLMLQAVAWSKALVVMSDFLKISFKMLKKDLFLYRLSLK